jgi:predicted cobalt transporter CbtA
MTERQLRTFVVLTLAFGLALMALTYFAPDWWMEVLATVLVVPLWLTCEHYNVLATSCPPLTPGEIIVRVGVVGLALWLIIFILTLLYSRRKS